jgi:hypothetical protein
MKGLSIEEIIKKVKEIPAKKWKNEGSLKQGHQYSAKIGFGKKVIITYNYDFNPHYSDNFRLEINSFGNNIFKTCDKGIISSIYSNIIRAN